jgi:flagellar biosynthetic protein FliR
VSLFNFNQEELLTFFAILVRYGTLFSVLPFVGDKFVPMPVKILLSLTVSISLMPSLIARGLINPGLAAVWGATLSGIVGTVAAEVMFALVMGYVARLAFEAISFGGNLVGTFMGFAMASTYDPQQESQTQVVAEIHVVLATLLFLVLDGHHLMLRASVDSYRIFGLGGMVLGKAAPVLNFGFNAALSERLIAITGQVLRFAIQMSAPVAVALFAVNVAFGVVSRAMPQMNILILSIGVSAMIGLFVLFLSLGEFQGLAGELFGRMGDWMEGIAMAMARGK